MQLVLRLIINAFAIWLAATWIDKIDIISPEDQGNGAKIITLLAVAAVFTAINALIKPIVQLLSLPLVIVTLGLFLLVVNALMLWLTAWITEFTEYGLRIDGFWAAFWGALIVTVVNWLLGVLVPDRD
ncbi:phage holin family protein [Nocardia cyriacigeorgica]|uniref:Phage holin family protein n=1 Tax=Nocardia cyriacigeorgica TaxID=135487 RepID=A0A6P1DEY2_9NOCA|nr:phage holin family protein [Nocardia cyriacigeorgica]NEW39461.1 phage holin family protein [Nocardia cyriacigeorgica]NEW47163.1 phage holin family protein [Nocardia cyriacigeorgica]NEW53792.1 phage holin family protein [Nocardia cyriacigeorgica]NEW58894.1 phage holin family protein [Nocardia cyriacigeorgica]